MQRVLQCFNPITNFRSLFGPSGKTHLDVLNGIRILMMCWISLGHTLLEYLRALGEKANDIYKEMSVGRIYTFFTVSTVAADVFFVLAGFFAVISLTKVFADPKNRNLSTVFKLYLGRYVRLIPVYAVGIVIFLLFSGKAESCTNNWWLSVFFINNYNKLWNICFFWSWYICCEYHYFLIAPLIIILHYKNKTLAYLAVLGLAVASTVSQILVVYKYNIDLYLFDFKMQEDFFDFYYVRSHTRINPYLLGMAIAWLYQARYSTFNAKVSEKAWIRYLLYITGIVLVVGVAWYYPELYLGDRQPIWIACIYNILHRPLFGLGVFCMVYPAFLGKRGLISEFLSCRLFTHMAKVAYGVYIINIMVCAAFIAMFGDLNTISYLNLFIYFVFSTVICCVLSIILTIAFESPAVQLFKLALEEGTPRKEKS